MSVILSKDGGLSGAYALVVDEIPAEKAAQLQSDVTALVFGFRKVEPTRLPSLNDGDVLETFLRNMAGSFTSKIAAIKAVRFLSVPTLGLKEAKDLVDEIERRHGCRFDRDRPF